MPYPTATARLETFGYWGDLARQPFVYDVDAPDLARQARLGMGHGLSAATREAQPYWRGVRRLFDEEEAPLCLNWSPSFRADWNDTSTWGGGTYLRRLYGRFGGNAYALSHERNHATQGATYTASFPLLRNQPFPLRLFVYKAVENASAPVVSYRFDKWLVQAWPGSLSIACVAPSWTPALQDAADTLQGEMEADSDAGWDAALDEFRHAHFLSYNTLSGSVSLSGGTFIDLEFVPEPLGALNVFLYNTGGRPSHTRIPIPSLIEATDLDPNASQTIYAAGAPTISTKGPAFDWQIGEHIHGNPSVPLGTQDGSPYLGEVICPTPLIAPAGVGIGDMTATLRTSGPAGSSVAGGITETGPYGYNDDGSETTDRRYEASFLFFAPDARYTPFLYAGQLIRPALPHTGEGTPSSYDSDDYKLDAGGPQESSRFENISMNAPGENQGATIQVRMIHLGYGALPIRHFYEALENRTANLEVNGAYVLRNGLVLSAEVTDARTTEPNLPDGNALVKVESKVILNLSDGWALLDEIEEMPRLILDGLRLGEALRLILSVCGWSDTEMGGIPENFGTTLPTARIDEEPLLVTSGSPGAMLGGLLEDWGFGAQMYQDPATGWWTVATPSGAPVLALSGAATPASRLKLYAALDWVRDFSEAYNDITVIGGTNHRGQTLSYSWTARDGLTRDLVAGQRFQGRRRRKVIERRNLRRADDVLRVLRSQVVRFGEVTGRFASAPSHAHLHLRAGMVVTLDGRLYTVARVGAADVKEDRMTNVYREHVAAIV